MPSLRAAEGNCFSSPRQTRIARALESTATSRQFSGVSSMTKSRARAAAIRPRDPCTTYTLGSLKPFDSSQRWVWTCEVDPALPGRFVRKIVSQRRSVAIAARRAIEPGSISFSVSQKLSMEAIWRQRRRCWRAVKRRAGSDDSGSTESSEADVSESEDADVSKSEEAGVSESRGTGVAESGEV